MMAPTSFKTNFKEMKRLADMQKEERQQESLEMLERAGSEPTSDADSFADRNGYDPNFLSGLNVPLPLPLNGSDMRQLRRGGSGVELKYQNFSIIMSASRRMAMFTACNIDGGKPRTAQRVKDWSFDGRLDKEDQLGDIIYDNNILDRGHMVRRQDPIWGDKSEAANRDTFHFTNSCPQITGVNQGVWLELENYILDHAKADRMLVNVYTGPFFKDDDMEYKGARIPASFWKVVVIIKEDGMPSATAYKVSQERELSDLEFVFSGFKTFQISIQQVIDESGLDFNALLPFDGFSQHESATNSRLEIKLETPGDIRI
jgi:endonuclease G, mitochondrial